MKKLFEKSFLRSYCLELLFLASFLLPFRLSISVHNSFRTVDTIYGVGFILEQFFWFSLLILCYVFYIQRKKHFWSLWFLLAYLVFLAMAISQGEIIYLAPTQYIPYFTEVLSHVMLFGLPVNVGLALALTIKMLVYPTDHGIKGPATREIRSETASP